jgi:hypothetical protein
MRFREEQEPTKTQADWVKILKALLATNGCKMLAK